MRNVFCSYVVGQQKYGNGNLYAYSYDKYIVYLIKLTSTFGNGCAQYFFLLLHRFLVYGKKKILQRRVLKFLSFWSAKLVRKTICEKINTILSVISLFFSSINSFCFSISSFCFTTSTVGSCTLFSRTVFSCISERSRYFMYE